MRALQSELIHHAWHPPDWPRVASGEATSCSNLNRWLPMNSWLVSIVTLQQLPHSDLPRFRCQLQVIRDDFWVDQGYLPIMGRLQLLFLHFKRELQLYRNILADARTPRLTKLLLGLAVAYALSPVDFIPDFIPLLGHLDDAVIVPVLVYLALKAIPKSLLDQHRRALRL